MRMKKKLIINIILLCICVAIRLYSADSERVESGYSSHFYKFISGIFRATLGWIPFSIGDILYTIAAFYLLYFFFRFLRTLFSRTRRKGLKKTYPVKLLNLLTVIMMIYIVFNIFWGINYNRIGIASQLGFETEQYSDAQLDTINRVLVFKVNENRALLTGNSKRFSSDRMIFNGVSDAYKVAAVKYPFLSYPFPSMKPSLFGWVGSYTGFSGYYNPFTGECQVNTDMPQFIQPFTACHEAAHSIGYAKEDEANFAGYLAASSSQDPRFRYSVYLDLFLYANRSLYAADSTVSKAYREMLSPSVKKDIEELRDFNRRHRSIMAPVLRLIYGKYLESNQQPKGLDSYDEVTSFIIAYFKKFGKI